MTATVCDRTRYRGVVYGIDLLDHESVVAGAPEIVADDYVGKTRQRGRGRENQHRDDKPWADLIIGSSHVLWEGICDEDELDRREVALIRDRAPRMNDRDNRWNRERIDYATQIRQRHERDDLAGRPRWQSVEERQRESLLEWDPLDKPLPPRYGHKPARPWKPWQKLLLRWGIAWLVGFVAGWVELTRRWDFTERWQAPAISATTVLAVLVWLWLGAPPLTKKRWRRFKRRLPGWLK